MIDSGYVTNNKAIASLTLGILSLVLAVIGFISGIIGIFLYASSKKEMEQHGEAGNGLAIAGLICSIVGIIIQLFAIIAVLNFFAM